jgi:hypothetical protein
MANGSVDLILNWRSCNRLSISGKSWGMAPVGAATRHLRRRLGVRSEWSGVVGAGGDLIWRCRCWVGQTLVKPVLLKWLGRAGACGCHSRVWPLWLTIHAVES